MRWLIDGYNVIRRDPDLRAAEARGLHAGREALLRRVAAAARRLSDRFTVVFDGAPVRGAAPSGRLEVVFSRPPQKADDVLVRLAREGGAGTAVVTDDRAVGDAARRARCAVVPVGRFLAALGGPEGGAADDDPDGESDDAPHGKRGNPYRRSREDIDVERALRRLRGQ